MSLLSGHCISRTDHHNPLDIQITYTKLKHGVTDLYKKGQLFLSTLFKTCFWLQFTNTRVLTFQPFQLQLKNEHFLKVKVKCYSKKMIPIEKLHRFYLMILMIDCKLDWSHSTQLVSNEHISITSIKCFSITIEDRNQNINMAVMFLGTV